MRTNSSGQRTTTKLFSPPNAANRNVRKKSSGVGENRPFKGLQDFSTLKNNQPWFFKPGILIASFSLGTWKLFLSLSVIFGPFWTFLDLFGPYFDFSFPFWTFWKILLKVRKHDPELNFLTMDLPKYLCDLLTPFLTKIWWTLYMDGPKGHQNFFM